MKTDIHPTYHPKAKIKCACGHVFTIGSTKESIEVEICSNCHPFYTGKEKLIDTAGKVEKFKTRTAIAKAAPKKLNKTEKRAQKAKLKKEKSQQQQSASGKTPATKKKSPPAGGKKKVTTKKAPATKKKTPPPVGGKKKPAAKK